MLSQIDRRAHSVCRAGRPTWFSTSALKAIALALAMGLAALPVSAEQPTTDPSTETEPTPVSFKSDIEPIFSRNCYGCHQGAKQLGSYLMTQYDALVSGGESQEPAIVPGKPDESYLVAQITPVDGHAEMPDEPFEPLSQVEIDLIRRWISEGAKNDAPSDNGPKYSAENRPVYVGPPAIASIDVSPDGSTIAASGLYEVILLDAQTGQAKSHLVGMSPRINAVRFSPDGTRLAAAGGTPGVRGELQIWNVDQQDDAFGQLQFSQTVTYDTLNGVSWSPDGSKIAFGGNDNVVRGIDTATGEPILYQGAHQDWVLDTAFTPDGKHVISVARDMSCKLTEVETERFIDNITSITPFALSGGLSSVVAHPQRNEIVIGGADGVAKVYRVFRVTERKIGDDANLVRKMPKLPGRIFSVDLNADASRIAAAATLDGKSEVRVWKYDFTGELSDELKQIMRKVVSQRSAEEKEKVRQYKQSKVTELAAYQIDDAAVYAIAFGKDDELIIASSDGMIRRLDADGKLIAEFPVVEVAPREQTAATPVDPRLWNEMLTQRMEQAAATPVPHDQVERLVVHPDQIQFTSPYDYAQLVVTAVLKDGSTADVTRVCQVDAPGFVTVSAAGMVRPVDNGNASAQISLGSKSQTIGVAASGIRGQGPEHGRVDFIRDVGPILSRLGCNAGTCHGAQKGKNGFKLSLRGYDAAFDIRALTDDLAARRINAAAPEASLMLRKPLGLTPHQGGALMTEGDPYHTILRRWIADGSRWDPDSPRVDHIDVFPINPVVQQTSSQQQVRVVAHYTDGSTRDVTREAFIESGNTEVATTDATGLLTSVRRGEAPVLARYEGAYAATTLTVMGDRKGYQDPDTDAWSRIDELVAAKWRRVKVVPSGLCDDATFLRRVYLDLTGLPPTSQQVRDFLADETPTRVKRARVIDHLIGSEAYIDFWTNKWADLLQVNRKFLGVEGSTKFRDWIRQAVAENRPYDEFARQILTASGSNNENPPASYYKVLRTPEDSMENTTHLFLGIRFNCNKCHDHPFERWTQDQYYQLSAFFAQVGLERDPASGKRTIGGTAVEGAKPLFEKVVDKTEGEILHPKTSKPVEPEFPYPVAHQENKEATRREHLAAWITAPENPYFARSYVNRMWGYLLGVGLIEPIDDIRAGNPPTNPELLDFLTNSFVQSGFDIAHLQRMICNSRAYQLSVETNPWNEDDQLNYSHALPRRLPAEVIYDAVHAVTGAVSDIPGVPKGTRAAALTDSGIKLPDGFLQNLGRPARESACECERSSELQLGPVMALISGPTIGSAISDPKNELDRIVQQHKDDDSLCEEIFLRALGRMPNDNERAVFKEMKTLIRENHADLVAELERAEEAWKQRRVELEAKREQRLAKTIQEIEARQVAIKSERDKMEQERQARIKAAEVVLTNAKSKIGEKIKQWEKTHQRANEWFPLAVDTVASTSKAVLQPQDDRSIIASGDENKATYTVTATTSLKHITGFRLEVIADPKLPSNGPGRGDNGNFVLTELEIMAHAKDASDKPVKVQIASAVADFTQQGFNIKQTFNGQTRNQQGWAVAGATGVTHWATFKLKEPIEHDGQTVLTFQLHQFHNAAKHRIGRFRLSATTDDGDIALGQPESFAAVLTTPVAQRSDQAKALLETYLSKTDPEIRKAEESLAAAKAPLPPDSVLVQLEKRKKELSAPTPDDPALVQLRDDVKQSTKQLQNIRLTAAEDLTWALINSPAFLFNH